MLRILLPLLLLFTLVSCSDSNQDDYDPAHDYFTFANTDEFLTEHLELDLMVDFVARQLKGSATLHMRNLHPQARSVVLDTRDLDIREVSVGLSGDEKEIAEFRLTRTHALLGQALEIDLPEGFDPQGGFELRIDYRTSPGATALQWLPPELTAGGEYPLMFSQSQSIHARSWIPLQDTPSVRITYAATVRTPPNLLALMSADNDPDVARSGEYRFEMPQPIPSYLMAIAAGNLFFARIGDETGVYSEPEQLPSSAFEFSETQGMLDVAETLFGPYEWGRYDLLILPPSFPYGGMENPRLSFITPSVLAGDRSLVSLIAHELAHSWSGNLVTNATWRDIWINEGTTSYLEARLMEQLFGKARTDEERVLAWEALQQDLLTVEPRFQALAPMMELADGNDGQDGLQYAKGQFFLEHMERVFGRDEFDAFMQGYFRHFAWQSITSEQFLKYLDENLLSSYPEKYSREQAAEWLYEPGVPADFQPPRSVNLDQSAQAAVNWARGELTFEHMHAEDWSPQATVHFINYLPADLDTVQLQELDDAFGFSQTRNAEIGRAWFIQVARRHYQPAYGEMRKHLLRHGRMRLVSPVYAALFQNGQDAALAEEIFSAARPGYHPLTVEDVQKALVPK